MVITSLCCIPTRAPLRQTHISVPFRQVYECEAVNGCKRVSTDTINLSELILVDLDKKQLTEVAIGENGETEDIGGIARTINPSFCTASKIRKPGTRRSLSKMVPHWRHLKQPFFLRRLWALHAEIIAAALVHSRSITLGVDFAVYGVFKSCGAHVGSWRQADVGRNMALGVGTRPSGNMKTAGGARVSFRRAK